MDIVYRLIIEPHSGLYEYGSAKRGQPLPMVAWPSTVFGMLFSYLLLVKIVLPLYMRNRKPYSLRAFMLTYNIIQIIWNLYMGIAYLRESLRQPDPFFAGCFHSTPVSICIHELWIINKFCDLIETVIFVLRGNRRQVTFLHIYHHIIVIYYAYMSFLELPGGYQALTGMLNTFVHALMYMYYFASALDRTLVERFVDYKKRITQVQLVQFCLITLYFCKSLVGQCEFPAYLTYSGITQSAVLFLLFANFYYKTYIVSKAKSR